MAGSSPPILPLPHPLIPLLPPSIALPSPRPRRVLADTRIRGIGGKPLRGLEVGASFVVSSDVRSVEMLPPHGPVRAARLGLFGHGMTRTRMTEKNNFSTMSAIQRLPCRHMTLTRTSNLNISEDTSSEEYGGRRVTSMKFIVWYWTKEKAGGGRGEWDNHQVRKTERRYIYKA